MRHNEEMDRLCEVKEGLKPKRMTRSEHTRAVMFLHCSENDRIRKYWSLRKLSFTQMQDPTDMDKPWTKL